MTTLLAEAFALHQAGRLNEAERLYNRVLTAQPKHFDSRHLLGVICQQRGDHSGALRQFDLALEIEPRNVLALNNRGISLKELRRFDEALASYDRALAVRPDYPEALFNRGNVLQLLKRLEDALASYDRALTARPDHAAAWLNRGNTLKALNRHEAAVASYDRALTLQPAYAEALCSRAGALHDLGRFEAALADSERALALRPDFAEAHANRGNALQALKRLDDAVASYDRALALRPDLPKLHANRANALSDLRRFDEALASYDRALVLQPDDAETQYNRSNALHADKRFEEAVAGYDRALALRPDYAEAHANRGASLHELMRFDEALANYRQALVLRPDFADAHYNEALCRLLIGDYETGWKEHEWRWATELLRNSRRSFTAPLWLGAEDVRGRTVLLHAEQGLGDTIQFARYAPLVAERGARVILEVQKPLCDLMHTLPGGIAVVAAGEPLPAFDLHCPLLSLPLAFATRLESIPARTPYLSAAEEKSAAWRKRLGAHDRRRIGLVWAGNPRKQLPNANRIDAQRSLTFDQLAPLLEVEGCVFYSLQKGDDAVEQLRSHPLRQRVIDWTDEFGDFADTAALVANLDLVIAVDTSVAHLAGALGKPFWLLNRHNTCWRWLLGRDDSPWYPTARQFRQDAGRDWAPVIARVRDALRDFSGTF